MRNNKDAFEIYFGFELFQHRKQHVIHNQKPVLRMVGNPRDLVRMQPQIQRMQDSAHSGDAVVRLEMNMVVPHQRGYAITFSDARRLQALRQPERSFINTAPCGAMDASVGQSRDHLYIPEIFACPFQHSQEGERRFHHRVHQKAPLWRRFYNKIRIAFALHSRDNRRMKRSGFADLPLHGGRVPPWLAERMTLLGTGICEAVLYQYGTSELLSRLSDPFWFQALGCVMGMDWHSSGITTSVMGALKRGLNPRAHELGIYICGGRGRHSRKTPDELRAVAERASLNGEELARNSRLTARIDNNAIADGFQLYLHSFVVSSSGEWTVVQQGMNDASGLARRYHWHSASVRDFISEPHTAIVGDSVIEGDIMNLVEHRAKPAQKALLEVAHDHPERTLQEARKL